MDSSPSSATVVYLDQRERLATRLEKLVADIRSGRTIGVAFAAQNEDNTVTAWWDFTKAPDASAVVLLGAVTDLQFAIARKRHAASVLA